jgi:catenin beta 1
MDYHTQNVQYGQPMQQHQQMQSSGGLNLPDASSSSEKALMWSATQYGMESGYSTMAPSISSIDAFLNNEQMDSTISNMDHQSSAAASTSATLTSTSIPTEPPQAQPQPQEAATAAAAASADDENNAVANWINYQDNSEMALKAIPDLLKLLIDEDLVVVQQAAILLNQMSRIEGPRLGLIQTSNAVQCLVDCLNTTADLETARSLVGTLYGVSTQKPSGTQAIINSKALQPLVKMLSAPMETIVSYAITTLHNVLLDCGDKVKMLMRKMGAIHQMIPLLNMNQNVKFLSIVVDCLQLLAFGNQETKQIILELGGTQILVGLLANSQQYQKLLLNTTRLLKVLSVCNQNKPALVGFNAMQALSMHLHYTVAATASTTSSAANGGPASATSTSNDILQNCLITLRNLSDAATRLNGLEQLVHNLLQLLSNSTDYSVSTLAAGILSNLTCNNENNKKSALRSNGIQILLNCIQKNLLAGKPGLIEPCICALRHITNRHSDMLLAQEQVRSINGLHVITQLTCIQPRSWPCIKAALGLIRNFCTNQLNANQLRSNCMIEKLMQILYDAYTEIQIKVQQQQQQAQQAINFNNLVIKLEDVNLFDIVEASSSALLLLAKEYQNQIIMKDLDCIGFFVQMFYSPISLIQKAAASLLAELATNKECADVIEQQAGLHQFVQANFCNQYGVLKTIAEIAGHGTVVAGGNSSHASIILQHVTTLMQRLQDHKNQAFMLQQQQQRQFQQQQQQPQFPQQMQPVQPGQAAPQQLQQQQFPVEPQFGAMVPQQQQQPQANMMYYNHSMQNGMAYNQPQQQQQQQQSPLVANQQFANQQFF